MAQFDILIRGGTVIDGTGAPRRLADIGVDGSRITALGALASDSAAVVIDARDRIVAPGFIDSHTHDDRYLTLDPLMPQLPVTTVVTPWLSLAGISGSSVR